LTILGFSAIFITQSARLYFEKKHFTRREENYDPFNTKGDFDTSKGVSARR
jgi:hypothetical protein